MCINCLENARRLFVANAGNVDTGRGAVVVGAGRVLRLPRAAESKRLRSGGKMNILNENKSDFFALNKF
jgi:hypothetical protein